MQLECHALLDGQERMSSKIESLAAGARRSKGAGTNSIAKNSTMHA